MHYAIVAVYINVLFNKTQFGVKARVGEKIVFADMSVEGNLPCVEVEFDTKQCKCRWVMNNSRAKCRAKRYLPSTLTSKSSKLPATLLTVR